MTRLRPLLAILMAAAALLLSRPAEAGKLDQTFEFALDRWIELEVSEGPVTLHRFQLERQRGPLTKSSFVRPGNTEFLETVRFLLEYSNRDKESDWVADLDLAWLDEQGEEIDGYRDDEQLDRDERREEVTVTLSTLRYGIRKAQKLRLRVRFERE